MSRILSAITPLLISSPLFAATKEIEAAAAPVETVDVMWVIVFGVLFIGSIIGFFIYLWYREKNRKTEE